MKEASARDPEPISARAPQVAGSWLTRYGAFVFRVRNALFPVLVLVSLSIALPPFLQRGPSVALRALACGAALAIAGQAFRLAVIGYAYIARGGKDGKAYAEELVCEGFFAHARHPLYTGNLLIGIGICLMYGSAFTVWFGIPFFLVTYTAMALNEEAFLRAKFEPGYERYADAVPRFIPNFAGLRESVAPYVYDWRRALRKDYGQVALTLASIITLTTWRMHVAWPAVEAIGTWSGVVLVLLYAIVRTLKKQRLLDSAPSA